MMRVKWYCYTGGITHLTQFIGTSPPSTASPAQSYFQIPFGGPNEALPSAFVRLVLSFDEQFPSGPDLPP